MDIKDIHVGIDLGVQRIDSKIFGNIQPPEKDYYINLVVDELLRATINDEKNTVFSLLTYTELSEYTEAVQNHIIRTHLDPVEQLGEGYVRCILPINTDTGDLNLANPLSLINGVEYKIVNAGTTTDLSHFGLPFPHVVGNRWVCNIPNYKDIDISLVQNGVYQTINSGGFYLTSYGATDNEPGTIWTCNLGIPIGTHQDLHLRVISEPPTYDATIDIRPLNSNDYYLYIRSDSITEYGNSFNSGAITKGKRYKYEVVGGTNLINFGGYGAANASINTIFAASISGTPDWNGTTILKEVRPYVNRLIKEQDVRNMLTNSFGTVISSPVCVVRQYGLDVFHDNKFEVPMIQVSYCRKPVKVSYTDDITTDLPESIHSKLVGLIVAYIAADIDPQTYGIKRDKARFSDQAQ